MSKDGRPIPVRFPAEMEKQIRLYALSEDIGLCVAIRELVHRGIAATEGRPPPIVHRVARRPPTRPRVYFVRCSAPTGNLIKIGFTAKDPQSRILAFETGNPFPLELLFTQPGGREVEQRFHEQFKGHRLRGNREWFHERGELAQYIAERMAP